MADTLNKLTNNLTDSSAFHLGTPKSPKKRLTQSTQGHPSPSKTRPTPPKSAVNIAVSSAALFCQDEESDLFRKEGLEKYIQHQMKHENEPLDPGTAFPFIAALENVNACLKEINPAEQEIFNIILMSHVHAQAGVRLIKSINFYNLNIERMCLTGGVSPVDGYLEAYNTTLFLTSHPEEVEDALKKGIAAASLMKQKVENPIKKQLRVAFDLDAVLFADETERVGKAGGLPAFFRWEKEHVHTPLQGGPLKAFAEALGRMQKKFRDNKIVDNSPLRTYIVTARSAASAGERALRTLRSWGLHIDEVHFLAGAPKGPILESIKPHIFFDDQTQHVQSAAAFGTPAAHVIHGIARELELARQEREDEVSRSGSEVDGEESQGSRRSLRSDKGAEKKT